MSTRDEIITLLALPLGSRAAAEAKLADMELLVKTKAAEGVRDELIKQSPIVEARVKTLVRQVTIPFFIGAAAIGGISLVAGLFRRRV